MNSAQIAAAARLIAEDAKRMDWLERNQGNVFFNDRKKQFEVTVIRVEPEQSYTGNGEAKTIRDAIDAAMKDASSHQRFWREMNARQKTLNT